MSTELVPAAGSQALAAIEYTPEQIQLIKNTVAKGATDDEFKLFMYRAKILGLDPLKPGLIYFIKYGSNPGTIVVGIDGFRVKATRTGRHVGTRRGALRNEGGKLVGAWAEVYRSDWQHPAREEVSLSEYNTGKAQWAKMPETMIKKVAECAALRMAFPDDLGGVYAPEEMEQAGQTHNDSETAGMVPDRMSAASDDKHVRGGEPKEASTLSGEPPRTANLADYVIPLGKKHKGKRLGDMPPDELSGYVNWFHEQRAEGKPIEGLALDFLQHAEAFLKEVFEQDGNA